jgi:hypothetical protein
MLRGNVADEALELGGHAVELGQKRRRNSHGRPPKARA